MKVGTVITTPPIIDQRTVIYNAYIMMVGDVDKFKSRDISKVTGVDVVHVSALIAKCMKRGLIRKNGIEGRAAIYELTDFGIRRGEWLFEHYNPVTNDII